MTLISPAKQSQTEHGKAVTARTHSAYFCYFIFLIDYVGLL